MTTSLKVAIAGLGTVGAATVRLLQCNADLIATRAGCPIVISAVCARTRDRDRGIDITGYRWFDDPIQMANDAQVDSVVELIGGADGIARHVCEAALKAGKHVITANKALLAHHGMSLMHLAHQTDRTLAFEASVAGGIPVIKGLQEGLAANHITEVHGILNGTCNYILSHMSDSGQDFATILTDAQRLGYAEADPSLDIDGIDTAYKLAILASIAFGCPIVYAPEIVEGIRHITPDDFYFAKDLGYCIRLLGITRKSKESIEQRIYPCLLPADAFLSSVHEVFNAIVVQGDFVDQFVMIGQGAGGAPTASAVVADLIDLARGNKTIRYLEEKMVNSASVPRSFSAGRFGSYYLRLMVRDEVGVVANVAQILSDENVSIEQFLQRRRAPGEHVPVVVTTHDTYETSIQQCFGKDRCSQDGLGSLTATDREFLALRYLHPLSPIVRR